MNKLPLPYTAKRWGHSQIQVWSEDAVREAQRAAAAAALEEAAQICDASSLQPAIAKRIRALKQQK